MNTITVEVPRKARTRLRRSPVIMTWSAALYLPLLALAFIAAHNTPEWGEMGRGQLTVLLPYLVLSVMVFLALVYLLKFIIVNPPASSIASLPEIANVDSGELSALVKKRIFKSGFFYITGSVPSTLLRTRVSSLPNHDGTFWMMTTDEDFSYLTFNKYRVGEILEPNDPDARENKNPAELQARYIWSKDQSNE